MVPKIFISYAVESDEHEKKVLSFAQKLKMQGFNVLIFNDMKYGERFSTFMEKIHESDFVLFICTPEYKKRADEREGGLGYEWNIVTSSVVKKSDELKFIPVLFFGDWDTSLPIWARGKKGVDYREESSGEFDALVNNIKEYAEIESIEVLGQQSPPKTMTIVSDNGCVEEVEIVVAFEVKDTGKEYVIYTKGETDRNNNTMVYASNVDRTSGKPKLLGMESEEEWEQIKEILTEMSKSDDEWNGVTSEDMEEN